MENKIVYDRRKWQGGWDVTAVPQASASEKGKDNYDQSIGAPSICMEDVMCILVPINMDSFILLVDISSLFVLVYYVACDQMERYGHARRVTQGSSLTPEEKRQSIKQRPSDHGTVRIQSGFSIDSP